MTLQNVVSDAHCTGCGRAVAECDGCLRELDPPRFCPTCGSRLVVLITPGSFDLRCRHEHEIVSQAG